MKLRRNNLMIRSSVASELHVNRCLPGWLFSMSVCGHMPKAGCQSETLLALWFTHVWQNVEYLHMEYISRKKWKGGL